MNKKAKQMLTLGIVLLVFVAGYAGMRFWNKQQDKKAEEEQEAETIYVTDMDEVVTINYDIGDGTQTFEEQDGNWVYVKDPDFPLTQSYPQQMADTFGKLTATRELKEGDELADYGLDNPAYQVQVADEEGNKTTVYFGNATGEEYYVTVDDTEKVYTVSGDVLQDIQYSLEDMAQLDEYPSISSGNLVKETITENGQTITYDSENEDDAENIAAVAGGLGVVTLSSAADYSVADDDLAGYGLDESTRITVEATYTEEEEEQVLTLYIGNEDEDGNRYVMMNDSKIVYLISTSICDNILNKE